MKFALILSLLLISFQSVSAQSLSKDQLFLLRQTFCKEINGKYKLGGVAPYAWDLSTLSQVPAFDASARFARTYNSILSLSEKNGTYKKSHQQNLDLQRKFIKEFFVENVGNTKLEDNHFTASVSGDISNRAKPIFIFSKHSFKLSCDLIQTKKAKPCDFSTLSIQDKSGEKYLLCNEEVNINSDKLPEQSKLK